jgi:hypothetical protein
MSKQFRTCGENGHFERRCTQCKTPLAESTTLDGEQTNKSKKNAFNFSPTTNSKSATKRPNGYFNPFANEDEVEERNEPQDSDGSERCALLNALPPDGASA